MEESGALTFLFEGEVLCEVPALVVSTQEEERSGVVDLKRPEVENTLQRDDSRETCWENGTGDFWAAGSKLWSVG